MLRRPEKSGLGSAYRDGFRWGLERGFDVLLEMDTDLSHDPAALPVAARRRRARGRPGHRQPLRARWVDPGLVVAPARRCPRWGNRYAAGVLGLAVNDSTAGLPGLPGRRCCARSTSTGVTADGYGFQIEMTYEVVRRGGSVVEVPIAFADRIRGTSKMSSRIVVEALVLVTWWGLRDRVFRRRGVDLRPGRERARAEARAPRFRSEGWSVRPRR